LQFTGLTWLLQWKGERIFPCRDAERRDKSWTDKWTCLSYSSGTTGRASISGGAKYL